MSEKLNTAITVIGIDIVARFRTFSDSLYARARG
jgi:hypothetical protein